MADYANSATLSVLDVGHGNAAVIVGINRVVVVDTGAGSALIEFLIEQKIEHIDAVILSHADQDHIGGTAQLLASRRFEIDSVYLNTDSEKGSMVWDDLVYELQKADLVGKIRFQTSLTQGDNRSLDFETFQCEVLAPSKYLVTKGPGSTDRRGRRITSNAISAVIRVMVRGASVALLTGDIDEVGADHLLSHSKQINAAVMVFPHHGGSRGHVRRSDFIEKLCGAVSPRMVILSVGRGRYNTPDPEVIRTIRRTLPTAWIACTELSTSCAIDLPTVRSSHLAKVFSQGRERQHCCAGTIVVNLEENRVREPDREAHESFINNHIPSPMCLEKRNKFEMTNTSPANDEN